MSSYHICAADPDALPVAMTWASAQGWEPGIGDIPAFAAVDSAGWYSARDENDRIVTTLAGLKYNAEFGFMGLYITSPAELRGQGIGKQVWDRTRERLAECASRQNAISLVLIFQKINLFKPEKMFLMLSFVK